MGGQTKRGRSKGERTPWEARFVQLINGFRQEPAWLKLGYPARLAYIELKALYDGQNNGRIMASVRWLAEQIGCSKATAERAIIELQDHGFIVRMGRGALGLDGRGSGSTWRLTELGFMGDQPTKDYRAWQPKNRIPSSEIGQAVPANRTLRRHGVIGSRTGCPSSEDSNGRFEGGACPRKEDNLVVYHGVVVGDATAVPPTFTRPRSPSKDETRSQFACPECGAQPGEPCSFPDDGPGRARAKRGINHQSRYLLAVEAGKQQLAAAESEQAAELDPPHRGHPARGVVIEVGKRFVARGPINWAAEAAASLSQPNWSQS